VCLEIFTLLYAPYFSQKQVGWECANAPLNMIEAHANASILGGWLHNTTTRKMNMMYVTI
jgi:hypothetical protein